MSEGVPPILIMGMHRSGTSMIANVLRELGVFMGWELDVHAEAMFFLKRNEKILNAFHGSWDNPTVVDNLFDNGELLDRTTNDLYKDLNSIYMFSYLGPRLYAKYRSVFKLDMPWGWKDPRNTFLLPLWLKIFPGAKIIHVYRNGIDVAQSLSLREGIRMERLDRKADFKELAKRQVKEFVEKGSFLYFVMLTRSLLTRLLSSKGYGDYRTRSCLSIDWGFDLWCTYIERAFSILESTPNNVLHIKYEDFLQDPSKGLTNLQHFCDLYADNKRFNDMEETIRSDRCYAFKSSDSLIRFYRNKMDNYWMKRLGYYKLC